MPIILNLFHAVKLICSKILPQVPVAGNVRCNDGFIDIGLTGIPFDVNENDLIVDHLIPPMRVDDGTDPTAQLLQNHQNHAKSFADFPIANNLTTASKFNSSMNAG